MLGILRPIARTAKLHLLKARAERLARIPTAAERGESPALPPPTFIVACGRSGTTLLGSLLATHPDVAYLREPYHLWATIDPALDVTNLHVRGPARLWWDPTDATDAMRTRFARLILGERERSGRRVLVEKTPHNVYRVGLLEALASGRGRFIHVARDGVDVARSIERIATRPTYRMAGRGDYHQWWGSHGLKWERLAVEGPGRGHFTAPEVAELRSQAQRGAYEWLTSIAEVDRWRAVLGERLLEITYPELTADAGGAVSRIAAHVGATAPEAWLAAAAAMVGAERKNAGGELALPRRMAEQFNRYQERYGFPGRAVAAGEGAA